ncbi:PKD domain-containing protein [Haliscomenobacter sp.]|uniref:PKD domain-containing protein n=1 Tax=Haliscomenobacter sp. TaxID=2717303 RepID=UPI003BAB9554
MKTTLTYKSKIGTILLLAFCAVFIATGIQCQTSMPALKGYAGLYILGAEGQPLPSADFSKSYVDGAAVRVRWSSLETAAGVFNWAFLDGEIAKASSAKKKVSISILGTPNWLKGLGAEQYFYIDNNANHPTFGDTLPDYFPWDDVFVNRVILLNQQLAKRYAANPTVAYCNTVAGHFSRNLPSSKILASQVWQPIWKVKGYHPDTIVAKMKKVLDVYMDVFPNTPLWNSMDYQTFEPAATGHARNYISQQYANYGLSTYPDRFGVWREDLAGCNPPPTIQSSSQWFPVVQNPCRNGAQMLWSVQDGPTRMNQCGILPDTKEAVMDSAINRGIKLGMRYLEIYKIDMEDASLSTTLSNAHLRFHTNVSKQCVSSLPSTPATVNCNNFILSGNPESLSNGATWKYQSTDNGVQYDLQGVLFKPQGAGPFPVVLINHGTGGSAASYSKSVAKEMVKWGYICIAVNYTHSSGVPCGLPGTCAESEWGVSEVNLLRGKKCLDLLSCLPYADTNCIMAFGHSRGAFITAGLAAVYPSKFRALAHTAGGASDAIGSSTISLAEAQQIKTPYLLHHGSIDNVVALAWDADLAKVLTQNGVSNRLYEYPGFGHSEVRFDLEMYTRTKAWFEKYGCNTTTSSGPDYPAPSGVYCSCGPTTGNGSGSVAPDIAKKSFIKGILVRVGWNLLETSDDVYNWALLDAQIAAAKSYGKKVSLGIGNGPATPAWVYTAGAQKLQSAHPILGNISLPLPWDEVFLKKWTEFVAQLGARYQQDTTITLVYITNSTSNGIEMQVPLDVTPSWTSLGYADAKIINSWKTVMRAFKAAFPGHYLSNDFHPVNGSNVVADSVYAYAIQSMPRQYGASAWWWTQKNTGVYPAQHDILQHSAQNAPFTGVQMAYNGTSDSIAFGAGGFPAALQLAIKNGVCYWEVWNQDILNSKFNSLLSAPGPKALFDTQIKGNTVNFVNKSTQTDSLLWDFGDGHNSSDANPVHQYATSGKYIVTLKASTACEHSTFQSEINIVVSGLEHFEHQNSIDVFPNPNQGYFWVKMQNHLISKPEFVLFDSIGRPVLQNQKSGNDSTLLDYSNINPGVYYLSVSMDGQLVGIKKVVIIL